MKELKKLLKPILVFTISLISFTSHGQQIENGDFEQWAGDPPFMHPTGWIASNLDLGIITFIGVQQSAEECAGNFSAKIRSEGYNMGEGYLIQTLDFDIPISSASISYSYAVDSIPEDTYGRVQLTALHNPSPDSLTVVGSEEIVYNEVNTECNTGSLTLVTNTPFDLLEIKLSAHPKITGTTTEGISVIRFDDIVLSTTVGTGSVSKPTLEITLQPNPVLSHLTIKTDASIQELILTDINGRWVKKLNPDERSIDMNKLSSGVYILRITTPDGIYNEKVVKE